VKTFAGAILAVWIAGCAGASTTPSPLAATVAFRRPHLRPAYWLVYSFNGGESGRDPHAGPLVGVDGTLYGTTVYGGGRCHNRCFGGTVFAIATPARERVLHSFKGIPNDGKNPRAGLIDVAGTLYGTTIRGGVSSCYCGTVFKLTLPGVETVLHSFGGEPDGSDPDAGLLAVNGALYGTTFNGGTTDEGTVFAIAPSGAESVLYSFKGGPEDGAYPTQADLVDVNGTLYGMTKWGGTNDRGTLFSIMTSGSERLLHSFGGPGDGLFPYGGLLDVNGTLYGTTSNGGSISCGLRYGGIPGCGTVFKATTSGAESVLHSFGAFGDGEYPYAGLVDVNGLLYGTTTAGGMKDAGTVFAVSP